MFLLAHEIFRKRSRTITLKIGDPIPGSVFTTGAINKNVQSKLLRKHVYRLGKNKPEVFKTEKTIVHPLDAKIIKKELAASQLLFTPADGKKLFLVQYDAARNVLKEVARLREVTFRKVGEGTGGKSDFDNYDKYYKHIILWDEDLLEIIGAYRLGVGKEIIDRYGKNGLYTHTLFDFAPDFEPYLVHGIELGRSFIQQKYWRSNALEYLWQGIGIFISQHSDINYLFGSVSISNNYSIVAKNLIVYFYEKWFGNGSPAVFAKNRFIISKQDKIEVLQILSNENFNQDYQNLKLMLKNYGYTIPVLFRKYTDLCERDGVHLLDFCVDENFSNCVDAFILLHLDKIKPEKKERYNLVRAKATTDILTENCLSLN